MSASLKSLIPTTAFLVLAFGQPCSAQTSMEPRRINPGDWLADAPHWMKGMDPKRVVVHVEVTEQGLARHCSVVVSSGDALLDRASCWLTTINARYEPAHDATGKVVASEDQLSFRIVPTPPPPAQNADYPRDALLQNQEGLVRMSLTMGVDGFVKQCTVIQSSGSAVLDSTSCQLMIKRFRAIPPQNEQGDYVEFTHEEVINWKLPH